MSETCGQCRFWIRGEDGSFFGECHRYPPVVVWGMISESGLGGDADCDGFFPETTDGDWCGEFRPREESHDDPVRPQGL